MERSRSNYIEYPSREEWLKSRTGSIGASEVSIICGGVNSFMTEEELWEIKTGRKISQDLSSNSNVAYGTEAEAYLRGLFQLKHDKDYLMEHHPYRVYYHPKHKYLTATLDAELVRLSDNARGIWECKTVLVQSRKAYEEWQGCIPDKYYAQVCEQLYVTGWDFVVINCELRFPDYNSEIKEYTVELEECKRDVDYVGAQAQKFWRDYVIADKRPPLTIKL